MPGKINKSISRWIFRITLVICLFTVLGSNLAKIAEKNVTYAGEKKKMSARKIEQVLKEHTNALMAVPGVVGTGQGLCGDKSCIKVFAIKKTPELEQKIPHMIEGYPVLIEETGEFGAFSENE